MDASTKPKRINKHYWLDKGYEMVDGGLKRSQEQIVSIKTYINGLLAVYVIATIIDAIYMEIDSFWKLLIVMLPVIIVKWAVYYGEISTLPELKSFYPDSAESSEITYYQYLDESQKHVKKLKDFAFAATFILIAVLVVVTWWTVESKTEVTLNQDELKKTAETLKEVQEELALIKEKDIYEVNLKLSKNNKLFLEATLPKDKLIDFQLNNKLDKVVFQKKRLLIGDTGKLHYEFELDNFSTLKDSLYVYLDYKLNELETRKIKKLVVLESGEDN